MISRTEIRKAIKECQGEANPNSTTCIKLAAYYTILNNMDALSYDSEPIEKVRFNGESEFSEAIKGADIKAVLSIMDELMDGVKTLIPQLYSATIERLKNL